MGQKSQMRFLFMCLFILLPEKNILQIEIFRGEENMITMNQTHDKKFHCTYLIHYYPFDTQVPLHYRYDNIKKPSSYLDLQS